MFPIGLRIYQYRLERRITQVELASRLGIPQPNLSNIEKDKQDLTVSTLIRIAAALEIKPSDLLREESSRWKIKLTLGNIEAIVKTIIKPNVRVNKKIRYWADRFREIPPNSWAPTGIYAKNNPCLVRG